MSSCDFIGLRPLGDKEFAESLAKDKNLHVNVSNKDCNEDEFHKQGRAKAPMNCPFKL